MLENIVFFLTIVPFLLQVFLLLIVYKKDNNREKYKNYLLYIITILNIISVLAFSVMQGYLVDAYVIESTYVMFVPAVLTGIATLITFIKI